MTKKSIEILDAYTQRGWCSSDYLIDDSAIKRMIGRSYTSFPVALRATSRLADARGFAAIRYLDRATGEIWTRGAEPSLPGRSPLARYEGIAS